MKCQNGSLGIIYYDICRKKWQPNPVLLLGKSHGWRSQVGYSPWDWKESAVTEQLHFHFHYDIASFSIRKSEVLDSRDLSWIWFYVFSNQWFLYKYNKNYASNCTSPKLQLIRKKQHLASHLKYLGQFPQNKSITWELGLKISTTKSLAL